MRRTLEEIELKELNSGYFPSTKMLVVFKLKTGEIHIGRYDFNELMARRWFDEDGNEFTSDKVHSWKEIKQ